MGVNRRDFLRISAIAAGGVVVVGGGAIYAMSKDSDVAEPFAEAAQKVLGARFGDDLAEIILRDTWQEYETLLPKVPYIGGEKNLNTDNLFLAAYFLAMCRVLKGRGQTIEEAGKLIYETAETRADLPKWLLRVYGSFTYGKSNEKRWREQAAESQKRQYPGDWVFTFIEGDGEEVDYGLDMTECGICKFYHAQGADELTPYMCLSDYVNSKAFDRGLVRYKTLAEGAEKCDFRYKKGRETFVYPLRDGWPPQFLNDETGHS